MLISTLALVVLHSAYAVDPAWEPVGTTRGVAIYRHSVPGSDLFAFRGDAEVDINITVLTNVLLDDTRLPEWVDLMINHEVIEQKPDGTRLIYESYDLPWPVWDRDYVAWERPNFDTQSQVFTLTFESTTVPDRPPRDEIVRAELERTFWRLSRVDDDTTRGLDHRCGHTGCG